MKNTSPDEIRTAVRSAYGQIAVEGQTGCGCGCGEESVVSPEPPAAAIGYSSSEIASVPEGANLGLGCGNPGAIASLQPGETVVDLGAGGGFDCFLAAQQVGESGRVIGVDMTPEMVTKARENAHKAGLSNVSFRLGEIEHLPVADESADVIMSNCVINLSPEKPRVFREAFRVLRPGGRLAIADVIATGPFPEGLRDDLKAYTGCVSGAVLAQEIESILAEAGFIDISIRPQDERRELVRDGSPDGKIGDYVVSALIEARKP
jgi:SAM-dependent methyltransferase